MTGYRPDIDGLRAFSIIAVVIYHAFPALLPGGFVGVDVFFVISGYLITGIIVDGQARGEFSALEFYRRRIQRIIPALLLVVTFCLVAGWWLLLPAEYTALGRQTAASAVFAPNILFWTEAGYFDTDSRLKPLLHLWSLGVEEQFYLLWPLLLLVGARLQLPILLLVLGLLGTSFCLNILVTGDRAASFFLPQFRAWELLLGALLAIPGARAGSRPPGNGLALAGLVLLLAAVLLINRQAIFPGWWALLPTLGAALLILSAPGTAINRLLASRPLVFIGKISFPLYLWHWPLLTFCRIMEQGEPAAVIRLGAVLVSALLAWLSYRLVEQRLRYHPGRFTPLYLLAGLFSLGLAGLAITRLEGLPQRTAEFNQAAAVFQWPEPGPGHPRHCDLGTAAPGKCLHDGKPAGIAVLGDSHSTNTFFALAHHYRHSSTGVIRLGEGGCPPLYGIEIMDSGNRDHCREVTAGNLDWASNNADITTVFLSSMGPPYLNQRLGRYRLRDPAKPQRLSNSENFAAGLDAAVKRLTATGKQVVLVIDWPGLGFHPQACVDTRPLRLTHFEPRPCATPEKRYRARSRAYREIVETVWRNNPGTWLWDTAAAFCDRGKCHGMQNGEILYRDPGHLSMAGSRYLGERLQLKQSGDGSARLISP
ncbi:acyltransferase [Seongchinamella sediminis]|uniref:Acyltransferase n=1 Tax=Seongchinamella sediminis TaxID=2283635 RepID=A0A3L7DXA7_9GAMM|nr:acyltransferase family protein [Seongchinamella sediminis]RLQ22197.1 acyltransferase [Seongchinamella sediminis]